MYSPKFPSAFLLLLVLTIPTSASAIPDMPAEVTAPVVASGSAVPAPAPVAAPTPPAEESAPAAVVGPLPAVPVAVPVAGTASSPVVPAAPVPVAAAPDVVSPVVIVPPEPSIWQNLGVQALSYIIPIAGSLLSALVAWLLLMLQQRLGLNIDLARDSMLRRAIRSAIAGAEEWGADREKNVPVSGGEKLKWALDQLKGQGIEGPNLASLITSELGSMSGVGATGDRAITGLSGGRLIELVETTDDDAKG